MTCLKDDNDCDFDTESLIEAVKQHPLIWDASDEAFHDRMKKRAAWGDICRQFCKGFDDKDEQDKQMFRNEFAKKWRNIRDTFLKNVRRKTKYGKSKLAGRRYIYAKQLSFLKLEGRSTAVSGTKLEADNSDEYSSTDLVTGVPGEVEVVCDRPFFKEEREKKRQKLEYFEKFTNTNIPLTENNISGHNSDRAFFESLLPFIVHFTESQKLDFRCEIMNLVKKMRSSITDNIP